MDPAILNWLIGLGGAIPTIYGIYAIFYFRGEDFPHPIRSIRKRIEEEREALYIPYKSRLEELTGDYISRARPKGLPDGYERNVALLVEWEKEWQWIENLPSARVTTLEIKQKEYREHAQRARSALEHSRELERKAMESEAVMISNQLAKLSGQERTAFIEAMTKTDYYRYMSRKTGL